MPSDTAAASPRTRNSRRYDPWKFVRGRRPATRAFDEELDPHLIGPGNDPDASKADQPPPVSP